MTPQCYVALYSQYKEKLATKGTKKWGNYEIYLKREIANKLKAFIPTNE